MEGDCVNKESSKSFHVTQVVTNIKSNLFFMITGYWWTKHNSWSTNHTTRSTKYTQSYTFRLDMVSLFNKKGENYPSTWTSPLFNGILWQSCSQNSLTDKHLPFFSSKFVSSSKQASICLLSGTPSCQVCIKVQQQLTHCQVFKIQRTKESTTFVYSF